MSIPSNSQLNSLEQAIFATIAYYDYFNYPLTAGEIYKYLIKINFQCHPEFISGSIKVENRDNDKILKQVQDDKIKEDLKPKFLEILKTLDESESLKKAIERKNGFYFLSGRGERINQRIRRKKLADQKFKKAKWILKVASFMPFIRFLGISGSMGLGNPHDRSDIDLLIVAKDGRIWIARAFLTFFSLLLGKYRHTGNTEDRLCLNHYITDKSLCIDFGNLYKAQEYLNLLPISGKMKVYDEFLFANKAWIEDYIYPDLAGKSHPNLLFIRYGSISSAVKRGLEYLLSGFAGDRLEGYLKNFQIHFIKRNPLNNISNSANKASCGIGHSRIKYNDGNLVFHPILVEPEVIGQWEEKIGRLNAISS